MIVGIPIAPWAAPAPGQGERPWTIERLAALRDDGWLYELVEGVLVRMPPPRDRHGYLELEIAATLREYVKAHGLGRVYAGETGFDLTKPDEARETVLGADVAFLRAERVPPDDAKDAYTVGSPDLVVEIASPSQFRPELGAKAWRWLQGGARLVWVVWPNRQEVDVWTPGNETPVILRDGDTLEGVDVLPGFSYALAELFS